MTKTTIVEMSEGTYGTMWSAVIATKDNDTLNLFKSVIHQQKYGDIYYYTMAKDLLFGFIDEIIKSGNIDKANMILKNCHKDGYHRKHYTFK